MASDRNENPIFVYGSEATDYLSAKDKKMAAAIARIGPVRRAVIPDLFAALCNSMVGQQISTVAHVTIWKRMCERFGDITPERIAGLEPDELQSVGISYRKVAYMQRAANKALSGEFDIAAIEKMPDEAAIAALSALDGVGVWTAEMLLLFALQRPDILSYGDYAIQRGLRMLYRHRTLDKERFARYKRRFSPYGSVAGLYLWEIASGRHAGYSDPAPAVKKKGVKKCGKSGK